MEATIDSWSIRYDWIEGEGDPYGGTVQESWIRDGIGSPDTGGEIEVVRRSDYDRLLAQYRWMVHPPRGRDATLSVDAPRCTVCGRPLAVPVGLRDRPAQHSRCNRVKDPGP